MNFALFGQNFAVLRMLEAELHAGLDQFWQKVGKLLEGSSIQLVLPDEASYSLPRNFFSALFLYSYYRARVPAERRVFYVALNQCLRAMVTGCDNLLDDEYKATLQTDLPAQAHRFRSVLDIMVADRALFALLEEYCRGHDLSLELALRASEVSLQALARSGAQEASEEGGVKERLAPEIVLEKIHHYKTGILFQSTWAIPALFEGEATPEILAVQEALYRVGIGCQILDDIADLFVDLRQQRHNYVASVLFHHESPALREQMESILLTEQNPDRFYAECPEFARRMKAEAKATLEDGLYRLFRPEHQGLVEAAARFIAERIRVPLD